MRRACDRRRSSGTGYPRASSAVSGIGARGTINESRHVIEIKSILAPTDFSTHSEQAVRYACRLAERLGSELHLLHVLSEILPAGPDPLLIPVMPAQFYHENEDRARQTLERLLDPAWGRTAS